MEFTRYDKLMRENSRMYKNVARRILSKQKFIEYELVLDSAYQRLFVPCDGYETMDRFARMDYNADHHSDFLKLHQVTLEEKRRKVVVDVDDVMTFEADVAMRVSLMREKSDCASRDQKKDKNFGKIKGQCWVCAQDRMDCHDCDDYCWYDPVEMEKTEERQKEMQRQVDVRKEEKAQRMREDAVVISRPQWKEQGFMSVDKDPGPEYSVTRIAIDQSSINLADTIGFGVPLGDLPRKFEKYVVKVNSLMRGGLTQGELNQIIRDRHVLVRHRELVTIVTLGGKNSYERVQLTPGGSVMMPWLNGLAKQYKFYRLRGMVFDYIPKVCNKNLALINIASSQQSDDRLMSTFPCYQKMRACSRWIHPVECVKAPVGRDYIVGHGDPSPGGGGMLSILPEGKYPDHGDLGELWVSYEVELWGSPMEVALGDNIYAQLRLLSGKLGPEYGVVRYLFAKLGGRKGDRVTVFFVDAKKNSHKDTGVEDLRVIIRDPRVPSSGFCVRRKDGDRYLTVVEVALAVIAKISSEWIFIGRIVKENPQPYDQVLQAIVIQVADERLILKDIHTDVVQKLASIGVVATRVTNHVDVIKVEKVEGELSWADDSEKQDILESIPEDEG